jgi:hypothetical protein
MEWLLTYLIGEIRACYWIFVNQARISTLPGAAEGICFGPKICSSLTYNGIGTRFVTLYFSALFKSHYTGALVKPETVYLIALSGKMADVGCGLGVLSPHNPEHSLPHSFILQLILLVIPYKII